MIEKFKKKKTQVYLTETAEWDIEGFNIPETLVDKIVNNLETVPISDRDAIGGTVRYRLIGKYEIVFQLTSSPTELMVDVCGIRPPKIQTVPEKFKETLEDLALLRGVTGI